MATEGAEVLSSKKHKSESESKSLLSNFDVKVSDFLTKMKLAPKMVIIDSQVGLQAAFNTLISNHILSAPVQEGGHFIGFLDIRDLVSFVLFAAKEHDRHPEDIPLDQLMSKEGFFQSQVTSPQPEVTSIVEQTRMPGNPLQAITVGYLCRRNRFISVSSQDKLLKVLQLLSTKELHRVPVQNEEGSLIAVISQSNIVDYLSQLAERDPSCMQHSIAELQIGHSPVYTALASAPAVLAFDLMDKKQVFGVGVVDDHGVLVGNISASDIKLFLKSPNFTILSQPLVDFLSAIRRKEIRTRVPVAVVSSEATLASVVGKLAATKMHRLYVCDAEKHPLVVITLTNVLAALLSPDAQ